MNTNVQRFIDEVINDKTINNGNNYLPILLTDPDSKDETVVNLYLPDDKYNAVLDVIPLANFDDNTVILWDYIDSQEDINTIITLLSDDADTIIENSIPINKFIRFIIDEYNFDPNESLENSDEDSILMYYENYRYPSTAYIIPDEFVDDFELDEYLTPSTVDDTGFDLNLNDLPDEVIDSILSTIDNQPSII